MIDKLNIKQTMKATSMAAAVSVIVNAVVFFIFHTTGTITDSVEIQPGQHLTVVPVIISSILPTYVGGLLFFGLERFTQRGIYIFSIIAALFLLFSFTGPFTAIKNIPLGYALVLNFMHLVVGGSLWYFLRDAAYTHKLKYAKAG